MYQGYLELGGSEILNRDRAYGYAVSSDCPITWLRHDDCMGIAQAVGDPPYVYSQISEAPWYDPAIPETARFFGAYPVSILGIEDSTREASITEGILDGGVVQGGRDAVRRVRCVAILSARGQDALDAGMSWLRAALAPNDCGTHQGTCGEQDMCFFAMCPDPQGDDEEPESYAERTDQLLRHMHGVTCISGPLIRQQFERRGATPDNDAVGYEVEFTFAVTTPFIYATTRELPEQIVLPQVIQDVAYNLIPYPSAELASGPIVVATNYATNPSVEVDDSEWVYQISPISGPPSAVPYATAGRSNDIAVDGLWSYRLRILGDGVTNENGTAYLYASQTVDLPAYDADRRVSITEWVSAFVIAGATSSIQSIRVTARWLDSGGTFISATTVGEITSGFSGAVISASSLEPPAGTEQVEVQARFAVTWASSSTPTNNCDIRAYVDALGVVVP